MLAGTKTSSPSLILRSILKAIKDNLIASTQFPTAIQYFELQYLAKFFSSKVFPINIPNPKPALLDNFLSKVFKYGSPILLSISLGNPNPSSSIIISEFSLLVIMDT